MNHRCVAVAALALLIAVSLSAVVGTADDAEAGTSYDVRIFTDAGGSMQEYDGTGTVLKDIIVNALASEHPVEVYANGMVKSVGGESAPDGMAWVVFHWAPPTGWKVVLLNDTGTTSLENGTSYYVTMAVATTADGKTTYSVPSYEPTATAFFYIQFKEEYDVNNEVKGTLTAEQRQNGFWISGTGSNIAWAFKNACENYGFTLDMSNGVKGSVVDYDYIGWLYSFFGLQDETVSGSGSDTVYRYWSQFYWDSVTNQWVYSQTMGHYDPGVIQYFALVRQTTTKDVDTGLSTNVLPGQVPSSVPLSAISGGCTVLFVDGNGKVTSQHVDYFGTVTAPATAVKTGTAAMSYIFTGWDKTLKQIITDTTVTAQFQAQGLSISQSSLTMNKSNNIVITVTATDGMTFYWLSSDEKVATVADGTVTAVADGTCNITATSTDGKYTVSCTVTVVSVLPVTGVTVTPAALTLSTGTASKLTAVIAPASASNPAVTWSSSDDKVATVVDGRVTAVASGTASITVTTADGGYQDVCTVTVTDAKLSLSIAACLLSSGDTLTLTATASDAIVWSSSDDKIVTVDDGVVTAVGAGTATITAAAAGLTAQCAVTVTDSVVASIVGTDVTVSPSVVNRSKSLIIEAEVGTVVMPQQVLAGLAGGELSVNISSVSVSSLTDAQQAKVGSGLVLSIDATVAGKIVHELSGSVTVTVPYMLPEGKSASDVQIWYLADDGTLTQIECTYDEVTETATFTTDHLSYYAVTIAAVESDGNGGLSMMMFIIIVLIVAIILIAIAATLYSRRVGA